MLITMAQKALNTEGYPTRFMMLDTPQYLRLFEPPLFS